MGVGIVGLLIAAVVSTRDTPPLSVSSGLAVAGQESADGSVAGHDANINQLADNLFSDQVFAFELTSRAADRRRRRHGHPDPPREARAVILADVIITPTYYLVLAAVLFGIGAAGVTLRRNPLVMFMCIELMLNAVNLSFVALSTRLGDIGGQTAVFFVLVVAAAEVVVGLGIIVSILRRRPGATADDLAELKG